MRLGHPRIIFASAALGQEALEQSPLPAPKIDHLQEDRELALAGLTCVFAAGTLDLHPVLVPPTAVIVPSGLTT